MFYIDISELLYISENSQISIMIKISNLNMAAFLKNLSFSLANIVLAGILVTLVYMMRKQIREVRFEGKIIV